MHTRSRRAVALLALLPITTACGPDVPLHLGGRQQPVSIIMGDQAQPTPKPVVRPLNPNPAFPGFVAPAPALGAVPLPTAPVGDQQAPTPSPSPSPPAPACPATSPLDVPELETTVDVAAPPAEASYPFRREGTTRVGDQEAVPLISSAMRDVKNPAVAPTLGRNIMTFDIVQRDPDATTTTSYQVDPGGAEPGLKITSIMTATKEGTDTFAPDVPVRIMTLPASREDAAKQSGGTDPLTGNTMLVSHQTVDTARVEACGNNIDTWKVVLEANVVNAVTQKNQTIHATIYVATQYGALIVKDYVQTSGTGDGGVPVALESTTTINETPVRVDS